MDWCAAAVAWALTGKWLKMSGLWRLSLFPFVSLLRPSVGSTRFRIRAFGVGNSTQYTPSACVVNWPCLHTPFCGLLLPNMHSSL
jgi:hypothetical protein